MLKKIITILTAASMLASACVVYAEGELPFTDVSQDAWYYDTISKAYDMKLIAGMSETEFAPQQAVTGAQFIMMLYRADGNTDESVGEDELWYSRPMEWAVNNYIVVNDINWSFYPDEELTRENMMVVLYKYMKYRGDTLDDSDDLSRFGDSGEVSSYAYPYVAWLVGRGYIQGDGDMLRPGSTLTRAETATILVRAVDGMTGYNQDIPPVELEMQDFYDSTLPDGGETVVSDDPFDSPQGEVSDPQAIPDIMPSGLPDASETAGEDGTADMPGTEMSVPMPTDGTDYLPPVTVISGKDGTSNAEETNISGTEGIYTPEAE